MTAPSGRIDAYLVCGGVWHDFDFARLELLKLLAEDERVRVKVAEHYEDLDAITAADFLVSYTCDVRPSEAAQQALRSWVEAGGRWFALHGTNNAIDPPAVKGEGLFTTPRAFPVFADTLGSQFLSHPTIEPYPVTITPGAEDDPSSMASRTSTPTTSCTCASTTASSSRSCRPAGRASTHGFGEGSWPEDDPRLVMYRRPLGQGCVLYLTLGHCRGHYDMTAPPHDGSYWPKVSVARGRSPSTTSCCAGACRGPRRRPGPPSRPGAPAARRLAIPPARGDDAGVEAGQVETAVEAGVLDLEAAVGDHVQAGVVRPLRRGVVAQPELEPQRPGTDGDGVLGHRRAARRSCRNTSTRSGTSGRSARLGTTLRPRTSVARGLTGNSRKSESASR